ncbi:signal peptidase II [Streptomyces sp. NBC_00059]|uniref:signal peptidase II n=1 Tax=Streptomyces sp. NBC_00059 TaxID=2975635 RepID=UPI00224DFF0E|nr:signal peptidase II [Streptomyces sp. NBC_00059]MCX5418060.1 signal peptidase II [Streptomyces sp. NBC_00059]
MTEHTTRVSSAARRRTALAAGAAALAGLDLGLKGWAEDALVGSPIEGGPLDLQLAYNPGVAFSMGATAPAWVVVTLTAVITAAVAVAAWRTAPRSRASGTALALILAGAAANLIDRTADGVVTDYLHSGWWPTFNLADAFIVTGGIAIALLSWRHPPTPEGKGSPPTP